MLGFKFCCDFVRANARGHSKASDVIPRSVTAVRLSFRRKVIRQAMIELIGRLLHLLPQEMKRGELFSARVVCVKHDIIADSFCGPEGVDATRAQQFFGANLFE